VNGYPRLSPWWRDGLVWSCIGLVLMGVLAGLAIGVVMFR